MGITSAHIAAITAFTMWGLFPIYWKFFGELGAWDLFSHRLVWSFLTLMIWLFYKGKLHSLKDIWKSPKTRLLLIASAILISSNWLLYIYAVSVGKILEASLGYFLNPLLNVFLGWLILRERIRWTQWPAILLAMLAMIFLVVQSGLTHFPWLALTLSLSFATYGLIRKMAHVGSLEGLAFETCIVIIPTLLIWCFRPSHALEIFSILPLEKILILSLSGVVTCVPLILFAYGAKRLPFSTLGFINYLSPVFKFLCGWLIYHEVLTNERLQAFSLIWMALAWYTIESFSFHRKKLGQS
jgi:chloramphenicol-sensitive protein RarD